MSKTILIITHSADLHADLLEPVLNELISKHRKPNRENIQLFRLNLDKFPKEYRITHCVQGESWIGQLTHLPSNQTIDFAHIYSVWTRKPAEFSFISDDLPIQEKIHAQQETEHLLNGLLYSLDCYWMNHPNASRGALWKTEQSLRAARMGFQTPLSLVTNSPDAVKQFYQQADTGMALKSLSSPFLGADQVDYEERSLDRGLRTTLITPEQMDNIDAVKELPCYFQGYIDKAYELRITVIGNRVFAAKINSQDNESTRVDFRDFDADVTYEPYSLPSSVATRCRSFVHSYQLQYGALDIVVTHQKEYVFLENNPAGQFLFVQERVPELNMLDALARCLYAGEPC